MKTKPTAPRMPRARVFITRNVNATSATPKAQRNNYTAVIPCRTAQQARKLAAFWNLTEEERVERIAKILAYESAIACEESDGFAKHCAKHNWHSSESEARAVLAAITGGRT